MFDNLGLSRELLFVRRYIVPPKKNISMNDIIVILSHWNWNVKKNPSKNDQGHVHIPISQ